MRLSELATGQKAVIVKILGHGAFRKRMIEMGFVRGHVIDVILHAPLRDPIKYSIMGYEVSLRTSEANLVEVIPIEDDGKLPDKARFVSTTVDEAGEVSRTEPAEALASKAREINVVLIGNPNCGKTSLFNVASGAREHVGNYSGVTVDAKSGSLEHRGYKLNIVDLPGTYSLNSYSPEELYVRRYLKDETPDVIVNVVDGTNLERNLYLTTELIDMDRSMVIAFNMYDEFSRNGNQLDFKSLGKMIGVPIIPTAARTGEGVDNLLDAVIDVYEGRHRVVRHIHVNLGPYVEPAVQAVKDELKKDNSIGKHFSPRYLAIKLLEGDEEARHIVADSPDADRLLAKTDQERARVDKLLGDEDLTSAIANEKYGFIAGALAETLTLSKDPEKSAVTTTIDSLVTNRTLGFPIFIAIMFLIFWLTFQLGSYPMEWIESGVSLLSGFLTESMPAGPLRDLLVDAVLGGVGGVIVFLPNIMILYFCISFMEDSGYMARAAFIMDKLMHHIGLHGKSFIPLVMGFGCNVPAVIASRSIESRSSRIITILINPFMSCSARLPIYVLLIGAFFEAEAALVFLGLYVAGILVAMLTARLLRRFWFKSDDTPFVMELPPYRVPTLKAMVRHTWGKGEQYLRKMGGVILVASIIVWALNYFPLHHDEKGGDSYLEMVGKGVQPVMAPLGMEWRPTVAIIAGIPAKEVLVSTLGVLYTGDEEVDDARLSSRLTAVNPATGRPDFTPAIALSFMVFALLYCPCIATVMAIVKETGDWRYGAFSIIYNTAIAWIVAWGVYNVMLLVG